MQASGYAGAVPHEGQDLKRTASVMPQVCAWHSSRIGLGRGTAGPATFSTIQCRSHLKAPCRTPQSWWANIAY
jgi:hypothetical protein